MFIRIVNIEMDSQKALGRFEWGSNSIPTRGEYIDLPTGEECCKHYLVVGVIHLQSKDDAVELYVQKVGNSQDLYMQLRHRIRSREKHYSKAK